MTTGGLEFRDVAKAFGAVHALRGVSFGVAPGEAHACVGENGAGKSTLLKILAGIIRPDRGELWWAGEQLHFASPREALERGIGMVYQEMLAFRNLSVSANIFAGREITSAWGRLDEKAMRLRTQELLTQLHVPVTPDTPALARGHSRRARGDRGRRYRAVDRAIRSPAPRSFLAPLDRRAPHRCSLSIVPRL
jgi:rhamnose transport system ATP-binding protein